MSKINICGVILDDEQQQQLYGFIESYLYGLKKKEAEDLALKEIATNAAATLKIDKKIITNAAKDIWKIEAGKLNIDQKSDEEAAIEQVREIYNTKSGLTP